MDGCGIASACGSLGDCLLGVLCVGCGRIPLSVGLKWRRWRCVTSPPCHWWLIAGGVCVCCGGPNPLARGLTALRWCVFEGWCGVAGQGEGRGAAFPACNLFLPCVLCCFLLFSLVILSSCVTAWSGRMLTGHVDCECVLTASIYFSPPVCLSFPVVCGVLHCVRAGPHTPTARRVAALFCVRWFSVPFLPDCLVSCSPRGFCASH
ncbi:trans-sialidase [Trypanosoma cruzi cruzi]|nr:trans-sialidase [Trypanosoma cruzi cruzi]